MNTETHSAKSGNRRDFKVFRTRLVAELQIQQDRVDRARNELVNSEVTQGKLERDLQTIFRDCTGITAAGPRTARNVRCLPFVQG
jgi:hypothetical protein